MGDNSQSRKWQLTLNGIDEIDNIDELIKETLAKFSLDFYCYCQEIGNKTHNKHMHIFMYSQKSPIRFITIKGRFDTVGLHPHIEKAYGSIIDNIQYLKKEGRFASTDKSETSIEGTYYQSSNDIPSELREKDAVMGKLIEDVEDGKSNMEIIKESPNFGFKLKEIDTIRYNHLQEKNSNSFRKIRTYFFFGETAVGKSTWVYTNWSTKDIFRAYNYHNMNAIWDGYNGQKVVFLDELSDTSFPIELLLVISDIFPLSSGLSNRYHNVIANFDVLVVATNIKYENFYAYEKLMKPSTWKAFDRRWQNIWEFTKTPENKYKIIKHRETKYDEENADKNVFVKYRETEEENTNEN